MQSISEYTIKDATHLLKCKHCIGSRCNDYLMEAIILGHLKNGKVKVLVFGDRNWKGRDNVKKIRYVDAIKLKLK